MPPGSNRRRRCDMSEARLGAAAQNPEPGATSETAARRGHGPLVNARNVGKTYWIGKRSLEVLRKVDLQVSRGEFLVVRGASGAGKSTLLHCWVGWTCPRRVRSGSTERIWRLIRDWSCRGSGIAGSASSFKPTIYCP